MNLIERLKVLESHIEFINPDGSKGWSPCDDIRFKEALHEAWPKIRAVVEASIQVQLAMNPLWAGKSTKKANKCIADALKAQGLALSDLDALEDDG